MAKKAVQQKPQTNAVTTTEAKLPAWLQGYEGPSGSENIDSEDVTIPRLKIAQSISEEVKDGRLQEGALFLNVTGEAIWEPGDPPLPVIIVGNAKEYILWRPRKDGGGILARARPVTQSGVRRYAWDKPNQSFDVKVDGKVKVTWKTKRYIDEDGLAEWGSEIPKEEGSGIAATAHHNYVVVLPGNIVAAVSMARSGVKRAKDLNAAIKMRGRVPLYATRWLLDTADDKNAEGQQYKNWRIRPDGWVSQDDVNAMGLAQLAEGFKDTTINVDHSDGSDDEIVGRRRRRDADPDME